jgi:hypothetical protein
MRGKIVYQLQDDGGRPVGYCGRDPDFERKHSAWVSSGRQGDEPAKVTFPKGLHRGLLLYGEHRLRDPEIVEQIKSLGTLLIVEGPNDAIRLSLLGVPAVAICSNRISGEQSNKLAGWLGGLGNISATLLFDLDSEGVTGMQQALWEIAQRCPAQVGWTRAMVVGRFANRQPESLSIDEWNEISRRLKTCAAGAPDK